MVFMSAISAAATIQTAMTQQALGIEMVRKSAEIQAEIVNMLTTVAASSRGGLINLSA
jgi:hypothetical protein